MLPLEQFRAWEQSGRAAVHILQIDRGSGAPAHRLTLTDRPYYDKGVAGVKYHDTYPAPIQAIVSQIITDEQMSGTRFEPIRVLNASGMFDDLDQPPLIFNRPFVLLRGDPSWSLLETDLPYRFIEIARGLVENVEFDKNKNEVILHLVPVKYRHERMIGAANKPLGFGYCANVPATLEDSGLNRWRFNSVWTSNDTNYFKPRDGGVDLALTTDYTRVTESGEFRGLIQLTGGSPAYQLTCDLNFDLENPPFGNLRVDGISGVIRRFVLEHFIPDYPVPSSSYNVSVSARKAYFVVLSATKMYVHSKADSGGTIAFYQHTLASPLSGSSSDSKNGTLNAHWGAWLSNDSAYLYTVDGANVRMYSLSTPGDITTLSLVTNLALSGVFADAADQNFRGICLSADETTMYLAAFSGRLFQVAIPTARTLTGLTLTTDVDLSLDDVIDLDLSSSGKYLYVACGAGRYVQFELPTPGSFAEVLPANRECFMPYMGTTNTGLYGAESGLQLHGWPRPRISKNGTRIIAIVPLTSQAIQISLEEAWMLPRRVFVARGLPAYAGGAFYQGEVAAGQVLSGLLANVSGAYSVSRKGDVVAAAYIDPIEEDPARSLTVRHADFIGGPSANIRIVRSYTPVQRVTVQHERNYTVQSREQLAGSVTDDAVQAYSEPFVSSSEISVLDVGQSPREIVLNTGLSGSGTELCSDLLSVWQVERYEYEMSLSLRSIPLTADFGVGSLLKVKDHPHRMLNAAGFMELTDTTQRASTPDSVANSVTGEITILGKYEGFGVSGQRHIAGKWGLPGELSCALMVEAGGYLSVSASADGAGETKTTMTSPLSDFGIDDLRAVWIKAEFTPNHLGTQRIATFSYAYLQGNDPPEPDDFITMEVVTSLAMSGLYNSSGNVRVGSATGIHTSVHKVYRSIIMSGNQFSGTVVSDFDPRRWESGLTMGSSVSGEVWTLSASSIVMHEAQYLVVGRRINWSRNQQTLTVFK